VEGGGGGLVVSGVSRNRGGFVKCVAIQKRLGIPGLYSTDSSLIRREVNDKVLVYVLTCSINKIKSSKVIMIQCIFLIFVSYHKIAYYLSSRMSN
jgi:hypothetical protein